MPGKVLFLSIKCALDARSGAAHSIKNILRTLTEAGWHAQSLTMTLFDGQTEYPRQLLLGSENTGQEKEGQLIRIKRDGVQHTLFYTRSTYEKNLTTKEATAFYHQASELLHADPPDVIIMFGGDDLSRHLINLAGSVCHSLVFYLGNPTYNDTELFRPFDQVFMPSEFFVQYYHEKLDIHGNVIRSMIPPEQQIGPQDVLGVRNIDSRKNGFITFINPSIEKGATLFARLLVCAARERPDLHFLAVEGRMSDEDWVRAGVHITNLPNLWWISHQSDMRTVYSRTSILLFPSFWVEAAGRCIPEAQLGGIPVLGSNHSGIPEQMNGGGVLFDIPDRYRKNNWEVPTDEEVRPWLDTIYTLMDNDQAYLEATYWALRGARMFQPESVKQQIVEQFENLPQTSGPRTHVNTSKSSNQNFDTKVQNKKLGRNSPCPCGSGKKVKNCCKEKITT